MTVPEHFEQTLQQAHHPITQKLIRCMLAKQSNLCVSADLTEAEAVLDLARKVGEHICLLKTHVDIISDFSEKFVSELKSIARDKHFLLFEDRKFADIGNTVLLQLTQGIYKISQWADIINAHILPGPGIIQGLKSACLDSDTGLLLLAQMSSADNLLNKNYTEQCVVWAEEHDDVVMGFISQERLSDNPNFLHLTPGVKMTSTSDALGQRYVTPHNAIVDHGTDIIIVGRGIYEADDPQAKAQQYQSAAWL